MPHAICLSANGYKQHFENILFLELYLTVKILFFVVCWICCTQITCCLISSSVGFWRILVVCTSLCVCAGFCSARIRVLKNSLLCCEKNGMEYYLQLIFHNCISFFMFFLLGAFLLCSLFQNSIGILRFFFYEFFSMVFPVLEEMQQKLGSQILHIGLTKIFSRLSYTYYIIPTVRS